MAMALAIMMLTVSWQNDTGTLQKHVCNGSSMFLGYVWHETQL